MPVIAEKQANGRDENKRILSSLCRVCALHQSFQVATRHTRALPSPNACPTHVPNGIHSHFEIDLNSQHKQETRDERPAAQRCRRRGFIAPPYQPPRAARGGLAQPRSPPQPGRAIFVLSLAAAGEVALSIRTGWPKRPIERGGVPPRHQGRSSGCRSPPTPPAGAPDCRVAGLLPRRRI